MPNIIEITDFHAPELDPYARLTQNQLRNRLEPEKGIFIAESPKVIARALDAGYKPVSLLMEYFSFFSFSYSSNSIPYAGISSFTLHSL